MILFEGINFFAVVVSTIVYFFIGFVWYSLLFSKIWSEETGVASSAKPGVGALAGQFSSTLLYSLGIAIALKFYGANGIAAGMFVSVLITVFFVIPINSGNLFFTGKRKLFLLDVCERAMGSLVVGIILGAWK